MTLALNRSKYIRVDYFLRVLFSAALPAPIANLLRIYSARDYSRCRAHVLSGVIISFKCGALANPSISAREVREPDPLPSPSSTSPFAPFYLSLLFNASYFFLRSSTTIKLKKILYATSGPLVDPGRVPLLLLSPLASSYFSFITYYRPPPVVFRALRSASFSLQD